MRIIFLTACFLFVYSLQAADNYFVDLSKVANTSIEDDGIADNNKGGWSDEGINDMYVYPAVPRGSFTRNGFRFVLPEKSNHDNTLVMLQGQKRGTSKPRRVQIEIPNKQAAYIYVLQNAVGQVPQQKRHYQVATYTVHYEDGTTHAFAVNDGQEIQQWWAGQWWQNAERKSWPIIMSRNYYSMKWKKFIGVWATQFKNPQPQKTIVQLSFESAGLAAPVIWAVTMSDTDLHDIKANPDIKKDFKGPSMPGAGYFKVKVDQERKAIFKAAQAEDLLKGVRQVYAIRNDLLAVHVDNAFANVGVGNGSGIVEHHQRPDNFVIQDPTGLELEISKVGRQSYEAWVGNIGPFPANKLFTHVFYLKLAKPLRENGRYQLTVKQIAEHFEYQKRFSFSSKTNESPALKVNQVGYAGASKQRYAYMGWWAGDLGTIDFSDCKKYEIISAKNNQVINTGEFKERGVSEPSGERVYQMDVADLPSGAYYIQVPQVGRSATFQVGAGATKELYYHTSRAFFHQRAGFELTKEFTDFPRAASHLRVYESGYMVGNKTYKPKENEAIKEFRGGYHDAGDDDVFTYHLRATYQMLNVYEMMPKAFKDGDLNIPESGNKIPDQLDEAHWALFFFVDAIDEKGLVPLGRGHDQDAIRGYESKHGKRPAFGLLPGRNSSNAEFAAVAAQYARLAKAYKPKEAQRFLVAAEKAYAWLKQQTYADIKTDKRDKPYRVWAACELFKATGKQEYHEDALNGITQGFLQKSHWQVTYDIPMVAWSYLGIDADQRDQSVYDQMKNMVIKRADAYLALTEKNTYRWGWKGSSLGWGNGNGGGYYGYYLILAHHLTNDQRYLDAASLQADFQLGCNALSRSFITNLGARPPINPQVSPLLYTKPKKRGTAVKGISIYGLAGRSPINEIKSWYPSNMPVLRSYRDLGGGAEVSSEFTITETIGVASALYSYLYALDHAQH